MKKADIFWQTYLNLEKEVIEVSKFIFFTDAICFKIECSVTHGNPLSNAGRCR